MRLLRWPIWRCSLRSQDKTSFRSRPCSPELSGPARPEPRVLEEVQVQEQMPPLEPPAPHPWALRSQAHRPPAARTLAASTAWQSLAPCAVDTRMTEWSLSLQAGSGRAFGHTACHPAGSATWHTWSGTSRACRPRRPMSCEVPTHIHACRLPASLLEGGSEVECASCPHLVAAQREPRSPVGVVAAPTTECRPGCVVPVGAFGEVAPPVAKSVGWHSACGTMGRMVVRTTRDVVSDQWPTVATAAVLGE